MLDTVNDPPEQFLYCCELICHYHIEVIITFYPGDTFTTLDKQKYEKSTFAVIVVLREIHPSTRTFIFKTVIYLFLKNKKQLKITIFH